MAFEKIIVTFTKMEDSGKETDQRVRGKERRRETSGLDKDEFKMPIEFPSGILGKEISG